MYGEIILEISKYMLKLISFFVTKQKQRSDKSIIKYY